MPRRLRVTAPAKVNLFLGVGALREDCYHELDGVFHTLELADEVVIEEASELSLSCSPALDVPDEQNLALRAARAFEAHTGFDSAVRIHLTKHIPHGAGLGGGSSDAAAVIAGLAYARGVDPLSQACLSAAASVGADVPFFLHGGCALMTGRGDAIARELPAIDAPVVLVKPPGSISTAAAYRAFDADPTRAAAPGPVIAALEAHDAEALGRVLANNLAEVATSLVPECGQALAWLCAQPGVLGATVAGSGSAVFGVVSTAEKAHDIAEHGQRNGWWALATRLLGTGALVDEEGEA